MNKLTTSIFFLLIITMFSCIYYYYETPVKAKPLPAPSPLVNEIIDYHSQVKPILEQRCIVCHACYDAPCQLKMGSYTGIERGANKARVYDGERLIEANLTRLFEDAHTQEQWRQKEFFPVVADNPQINYSELSSSEYETAAKLNITSSVMAHLLQLKQDKPLALDKTNTKRLSEEEFPLDINRDYQCPTIDTIEAYKEDNPQWGMPYGLPSINKQEHNILMNWIAQGSIGDDIVSVSTQNQDQIIKWEAFLNQDDLKTRLMSRYLFEHLFLVNLYFDADKPKQFFKLIRSATAPGQKIKGIYTRRPFDDPKVERVYYRLVPMKQTLIHKSHIPIILNTQRMEKWQSWFLNDDYQVTKMPSYIPEDASNPFITFAQIPLKARYKYLLDESQNTIMEFIKGPVCRGQMALNVINDHFWVVFIDPDLELVQNSDEFMQQARQKIALPAEQQSNALPTSWMNYASMERDYLTTKAQFIKKYIQNKVSVDLDLLWDGNGNNENRALTIFRHKDAASVVKGLVGETPQTAWVLTYPLFERIHYLLVAGYDVYGNVGHQLNSRMYMDFLRMEGEFNFLSFLPKATQNKVRNKWYRGSVSEVEDFVYEANTASLNSDISYKTNDPYKELLTKLKTKFTQPISSRHNIENGFNTKSVIENLKIINKLQGKGVSILPETSIVRVFDENSAEEHFYTMLRHSAYTNISHLFNEEDRRLPEEDTVTIASGFLTSHPNIFMEVPLNKLSDFTKKVANLSSEQDYTKLLNQYGIRRSSDNFWNFSDNMHTYFAKNYPVEFAYLDFNRLENR